MYLSSLNSIRQTLFELESGKENVDGQIDRQMDVGHINLIGGLRLHATRLKREPCNIVVFQGKQDPP